MFLDTMFKHLRSTPVSQTKTAVFRHARTYSLRGPYDEKYDPDELAEARQWFANYPANPIPTKIAVTTFSRPSGSGGQKTNKTSCKATTRWPIENLEQYLPKMLHSAIRKSTYYAHNSKSILLQCEETRERTKNETINHKKLLDEISAIYKKVIPGETSPEQAEKVKRFEVISKLRSNPKIGQSEMKRKAKEAGLVYSSKTGVCLPHSSNHSRQVMGSRQKAENAGRLASKKKHGDKKKTRTGGGRSD